MARKTFNQFNEMSMSVTLKPKKNNMYKVTGVGSKMKKHGGIKKGEKFHDSQIDGMHDSGIKVKYQKEAKRPGLWANIHAKRKRGEKMNPKGHPDAPTSKEMKMAQESSDSMDRMADTWNDHADHKHPKVQKHIKKAEKAYNAKDHEGFYHHTQRAADHAYELKKKQKPVNERNTAVKISPYKIKMKMPKDSDFKPIPGHPDYKGPQNPKPKVKLNKSPGNIKNEAIQRRMDRKVIIATDPATGRKVVKVAPKREIDIGKGRMESVVNELKTSTIASYQKKAGKEYSKYKKSDRMDYDKAQGLADAGKTTQKHADSMSKNQDKYKKRGEGLARSKKVLAKRYSDKQVRMGKGVAFDKRYKGGNMTGASKAINKIKKGLADHPKVSNALRAANEQLNQEGE